MSSVIDYPPCTTSSACSLIIGKMSGDKAKVTLEKGDYHELRSIFQPATDWEI
jgi:hypothetical protein